LVKKVNGYIVSVYHHLGVGLINETLKSSYSQGSML
jgi:hypothetical protein